jgi:hypothetical protein
VARRRTHWREPGLIPPALQVRILPDVLWEKSVDEQDIIEIRKLVNHVDRLEDVEIMKFLEMLRERICTKCGMRGPQQSCSCDYVTPRDYE